MSLPARLLLLVMLLTACTTTGAPYMTEEARCRQSGGMWRSNGYCDPGGGGGAGY